jgi:hypothetical protein
MLQRIIVTGIRPVVEKRTGELAATIGGEKKARDARLPSPIWAVGFHGLGCGKSAPQASFAQQRPWMRFVASARRSHREAGEAQRSSRETA